jgi:hypothetical protein
MSVPELKIGKNRDKFYFYLHKQSKLVNQFLDNIFSEITSQKFNICKDITVYEKDGSNDSEDKCKKYKPFLNNTSELQVYINNEALIHNFLIYKLGLFDREEFNANYYSPIERILFSSKFLGLKGQNQKYFSDMKSLFDEDPDNSVFICKINKELLKTFGLVKPTQTVTARPNIFVSKKPQKKKQKKKKSSRFDFLDKIDCDNVFVYVCPKKYEIIVFYKNKTGDFNKSKNLSNPNLNISEFVNKCKGHLNTLKLPEGGIDPTKICFYVRSKCKFSIRNVSGPIIFSIEGGQITHSFKIYDLGLKKIKTKEKEEEERKIKEASEKYIEYLNEQMNNFHELQKQLDEIERNKSDELQKQKVVDSKIEEIIKKESELKAISDEDKAKYVIELKKLRSKYKKVLENNTQKKIILNKYLIDREAELKTLKLQEANLLSTEKIEMQTLDDIIRSNTEVQTLKNEVEIKNSDVDIKISEVNKNSAKIQENISRINQHLEKLTHKVDYNNVLSGFDGAGGGDDDDDDDDNDNSSDGGEDGAGAGAGAGAGSGVSGSGVRSVAFENPLYAAAGTAAGSAATASPRSTVIRSVRFSNENQSGVAGGARKKIYRKKKSSKKKKPTKTKSSKKKKKTTKTKSSKKKKKTTKKLNKKLK